MSGTWGAVGRSARVTVPVVVVTAAAQAATVAPFATPGAGTGFLGLAIGSFVVAVVALALIAGAARGAVVAGRVGLPSPALLVWALATGLVVTLVAVLYAPVTPLVLLVAMWLLPAPADRPSFAVFHVAPVRAVVASIVTLLVLVLVWVGALLSGFFITGVVSAALTWLVFGLVAVVLVCWWTVLHRLGRPQVALSPGTAAADPA